MQSCNNRFHPLNPAATRSHGDLPGETRQEGSRARIVKKIRKTARLIYYNVRRSTTEDREVRHDLQLRRGESNWLPHWRKAVGGRVESQVKNTCGVPFFVLRPFPFGAPAFHSGLLLHCTFLLLRGVHAQLYFPLPLPPHLSFPPFML